MPFEITSTRHTSIGTLRRGQFYALDERDGAVQRVLKPLLESGAAVKVTDAQVKARKAEVESLELPAHVHEDPDTVDEIAELEARLAVAEEEKAELLARAEAAEAALAGNAKASKK